MTDAANPVAVQLRVRDRSHARAVDVEASTCAFGARDWHGNELVFDDPSTKTRMTFTRIDDMHFVHRADVDGHVSFTKSCRKS